MRRRRAGVLGILGLATAAVICILVLVEPLVRAGGPILVGGPGFGASGQPFIWDPAAMPVQYRVDCGPLSQAPSGQVVINNAQGVARVAMMFGNWANVPTANISYMNAGPILPTGSLTGCDVQTAQQFLDVHASCKAGTQSPIVFDADGTIFSQLIGDPGVIGFAGVCKVDPATGHFVTGEGVLNGRFQDGINDPNSGNFELTTNEFNQAFTHEFGHFSGLDHSQINVNVLNNTRPNACSLDDDAGLPVMFPILICQARVTVGLPPLSTDDIAWISTLYPVTSPAPPGKTVTTSAYGIIQGHILFSDGVSAVQGVNVIARQVDNPSTTQNESRRIAVSVVSGYLFTGNPGQNLSCPTPDPTNPDCNNTGDQTGSRDVTLIGSFQIFVPPGKYTVEAESVSQFFVGGSGMGPLDPQIPSPGPHEFWHMNESATDNPAQADPITVAAGQTVSGIDIILNGTPGRFDSFETARLQLREPPPAILRRSGLAHVLLYVATDPQEV